MPFPSQDLDISPRLVPLGKATRTDHVSHFYFTGAIFPDASIYFTGTETNEGKDAAYPSILFFCPTCGTPWFKEAISLHPSWTTPSHWQARPALCPCCDPLEIGGSLFSPLELENYANGKDNIPHNLALRELLILLTIPLKTETL